MVSPRSMSMPPEASAPVLIVSSPSLIGSACARRIDGKPSVDTPAAAPAAWMNFLRCIVMRFSSSKLRLSLLGFDHRVPRLRGEALRLRQLQLAPHEVRAEHDRHHLVERVAPAHALAPH